MKTNGVEITGNTKLQLLKLEKKIQLYLLTNQIICNYGCKRKFLFTMLTLHWFYQIYGS